MKKDYFHHPLDNAISNDSLYLLEIASIYVDYKYKPLVIILLKYLEAKMLLDALKDEQSYCDCGLHKSVTDINDIINDAAAYIPNSSNLSSMISMLKMANTVNAFSGGAPKSNQFDFDAFFNEFDTSSPVTSNTYNNNEESKELSNEYIQYRST